MIRNVKIEPEKDGKSSVAYEYRSWKSGWVKATKLILPNKDECLKHLDEVAVCVLRFALDEVCYRGLVWGRMLNKTEADAEALTRISAGNKWLIENKSDLVKHKEIILKLESRIRKVIEELPHKEKENIILEEMMNFCKSEKYEFA